MPLESLVAMQAPQVLEPARLARMARTSLPPFAARTAATVRGARFIVRLPVAPRADRYRDDDLAA